MTNRADSGHEQRRRYYTVSDENGNVLYVYDRICTKRSKRRELLNEYGDTSHTAPDVKYYKKGTFAERQRKRAWAYKRAHPYGNGSERRRENAGKNTSYSYKPNPTRSNAGYGEARAAYAETAEKQKPLKLILDGIVNLFESIEERGRADERIAKQRALAKKRFYEYKNRIITSVVIMAAAAAFIFTAYRIVFVVRDVSVTPADTDALTSSVYDLYSDSEIIEASGIGYGETLYSFSSDEAGNSITFYCPGLKSASVKRRIPDKVKITVEADTPAYCAKVWGDYLTLSAGLRVIENLGGEKPAGLTELTLPPVKRSVAGRVLEFESQKDERFIRDALTELGASDFTSGNLLDSIDLSDRYSITGQAGGKYELKFGTDEDFSLKLRMGYKTVVKLPDENTSPAKVDLSEVGKAAVIFSHASGVK